MSKNYSKMKFWGFFVNNKLCFYNRNIKREEKKGQKIKKYSSIF